MNRTIRRFQGLLALSGLLAFLPVDPVATAAEPAPVSSRNSPLIPPDSPDFTFQGRIDFADRAAPVLIWQGSRITLGFAGTALTLRFGAATGQNFFNLTVDGVTEIVGVPVGQGYRFTWPQALSAGDHRLDLFKRTEADAGHVVFAGVEIAAGAATRPVPAPRARLRLEFFGDSIMVGACNEDGATDQWEDRRTHNHALSYTTLTATAFGADYRCLAISGMGIVTGYVGIKAGQAWDKLYPHPDAPRPDLNAWQPDVAFLNYGENDDSFTRNQHQPFPAGYTAGYVALVQAMRAAYPRTHFVLLRGGMFGGAKSPELAAAWTEAVAQLEAGHPAISHFVFTHWSGQHPRVSDDRAMADELTSWLKQQPWMARFR